MVEVRIESGPRPGSKYGTEKDYVFDYKGKRVLIPRSLPGAGKREQWVKNYLTSKGESEVVITGESLANPVKPLGRTGSPVKQVEVEGKKVYVPEKEPTGKYIPKTLVEVDNQQYQGGYKGLSISEGQQLEPKPKVESTITKAKETYERIGFNIEERNGGFIATKGDRLVKVGAGGQTVDISGATSKTSIPKGYEEAGPFGYVNDTYQVKTAQDFQANLFKKQGKQVTATPRGLDVTTVSGDRKQLMEVTTGGQINILAETPTSAKIRSEFITGPTANVRIKPKTGDKFIISDETIGDGNYGMVSTGMVYPEGSAKLRNNLFGDRVSVSQADKEILSDSRPISERVATEVVGFFGFPAKIGYTPNWDKQFGVQTGNQKTFLDVIGLGKTKAVATSERIFSNALTEEYKGEMFVNFGLVGTFGAAPKLVQTSVRYGLAGFGSYAAIKEPTPESITFAALSFGVSPIPKKISNVYGRLSGKYVPFQDTGLKVIEGTTIPTSKEVLFSFEGKQVPTVHTTLSSELKIGTEIKPAATERISGWRKALGQRSFYTSSPVEGEILVAKYGRYDMPKNIFGLGKQEFTPTTFKSAGLAKQYSPVAYGGYIGIGPMESGSNIEYSFFEKPAKAFIFRETEISKTPGYVKAQSAKSIIEFQTTKAGTYVPGENIKGISIEGQFTTSPGIEDVPLMKIAKGEGPLAGKYTYYKYKKPVPFLGERAPKPVKAVWDFLTAEETKIKFEEVRFEKIREAVELDKGKKNKGYDLEKASRPSKSVGVSSSYARLSAVAGLAAKSRPSAAKSYSSSISKASRPISYSSISEGRKPSSSKSKSRVSSSMGFSSIATASSSNIVSSGSSSVSKSLSSDISSRSSSSISKMVSSSPYSTSSSPSRSSKSSRYSYSSGSKSSRRYYFDDTSISKIRYPRMKGTNLYKKKKKKKKSSIDFYNPTLRATDLLKVGKKPKFLTGYDIRPVPKERLRNIRGLV